ncbi:hypothetical protein U9M48_002621 [Paspalum notatum var. saurae]|uniref:Uncharacterized protein n=1 Tax=Paspalum notatum var. saurae TaxID=547442 RepID=A0AAQ3PK38_PASNO
MAAALSRFHHLPPLSPSAASPLLRPAASQPTPATSCSAAVRHCLDLPWACPAAPSEVPRSASLYQSLLSRLDLATKERLARLVLLLHQWLASL